MVKQWVGFKLYLQIDIKKKADSILGASLFISIKIFVITNVAYIFTRSSIVGILY